jgi:hypothetical protein
VLKTERSSAVAIRFSGADGKVLSWTAANESVRTHSRLQRELLHRAPAATSQTDANWAWAAYLAVSLLLAAFVVVCWVIGAI